MKSLLKRMPPAAWLNAAVKCAGMKRRYHALCARYGSPSVLHDPAGVSALTSKVWASAKAVASRPVSWRPRVLFVGTDPQQDFSGFLQALQSMAEVVVFEHTPGKHGQLWPAGPAQYEAARKHNGETIRRYLGASRFDLLLGQMWGFSVDWHVLADARAAGMAVVNIAMDDRHTFSGPALADGSDFGTRGLAPHLTLACTAAAECVPWYEAEGCRAIFFPEATDPELFTPTDGPRTVDVSFVGACYGIREKLVSAMLRAGIAVEAHGNGWPAGRIATGDVPRLFARSRIVLGCGTIGHCDDFFALKLRDFDATATGSAYLTHDNPDLRALFDVGSELVTFARVDEAVEKVRYLLRNEDEREAIGAAGLRRTASEHAWVRRCEYLFSSIGGAV